MAVNLVLVLLLLRLIFIAIMTLLHREAFGYILAGTRTLIVLLLLFTSALVHSHDASYSLRENDRRQNIKDHGQEGHPGYCYEGYTHRIIFVPYKACSGKDKLLGSLKDIRIVMVGHVYRIGARL